MRVSEIPGAAPDSWLDPSTQARLQSLCLLRCKCARPRLGDSDRLECSKMRERSPAHWPRLNASGVCYRATPDVAFGPRLDPDSKTQTTSVNESRGTIPIPPRAAWRPHRGREQF